MKTGIPFFSLNYAQGQNHSYQRCGLRFSHTDSRFVSAETSECCHSTPLKPNRFGIGVDPSVGQCDRNPYNVGNKHKKNVHLNFALVCLNKPVVNKNVFAMVYSHLRLHYSLLYFPINKQIQKPACLRLQKQKFHACKGNDILTFCSSPFSSL